MRNEKLTAYSLHHKPYQDKRSLYYLFTQEFGIINGIGKKGIPQFVPLTLFASGKKSLKTLQQVNASHMVETLSGEQQYAALYLNEIILKLLPTEDPLPRLFNQYSLTVANLRQPLTPEQLRLVLRLFENALFEQIGYSIDFYQDSNGQPIDPKQKYRYAIDDGWQASEDLIQLPHQVKYPSLNMNNATPDKSSTNSAALSDAIMGSIIIDMQEGVNNNNLYVFSKLHRQLIDHLFDYKPLQSRLLWHQFIQYR